MGLFGKKDPKKEFADRLIRAIQKNGEKRPLRYDAKGFRIVVGASSESDHSLYLHNIYEEYSRADRDQQAASIERFSRMTEENPVAKTLKEALEHLMPRVRERFYYESLRLLVEIEGRNLPEFAYRPMTEHFVQELAYDLPDKTMMVNQDQLKQWGTTLDEGLQLSVGLLLANTPHPMAPVRPGLYLSRWKDAYAPSRLLLPGFIEAHQVDGEPVVAIPNRDTLLLTGSRDAEGLEELARRVHQAASQPRFMSGQAMILTEGAWCLYMPEEDHPARTDIHALHQHSMARYYGEQKELLETLHEKKGVDLFVASLQLMRDKTTNAISSYCVWAQGVESLLPEADTVMFMQGDPNAKPEDEIPPIAVSWEKVRSRFGHLMTAAEGYPARWRVKDIPDPRLLAQAADPA